MMWYDFLLCIQVVGEVGMTMLRWPEAQWIAALVIVTGVIAVGPRWTPISAAAPAPLPVPHARTQSLVSPSAAPARSGISTTGILTLYANKTADDTGTDPGDCTAPANIDCSLRAALSLANANPGSTINVAAGTFTLTRADASDATSGLVATASVTITGAGASSTIIEANAMPNTATYRVLYIHGPNVTVSGVTLRNGVVNLPAGWTDGGAGLLVEGTGARIVNSTISDNVVSGTNANAIGCGVYASTGDVTLLRTTISRNTVDITATNGGNWLAYGGGISASFGSVLVQESTIVDNKANGTWLGGAATASGGGIENTALTTVTNSTISGNSVNGGHGDGGGSSNIVGTLTMTNSTVARNAGGGIYNQATTTLMNTIVAESIDNYDLSDFYQSGMLTGSYDLVDDGSIANLAGSNNILAAAHLGTLGNYGGGIQSVPLLPSSPAIDAGSDAACQQTSIGNVNNLDQRGFSRTGFGTHCDIGAFEARFTLAIIGGGTQSTPINTTFGQPLAITFGGSDAPSPPSGASITFTAHPVNGASATLDTPNPAMTDTSGAASIMATANGTSGTYTVTASTPGATSVTISLTNTPPSLTAISPPFGGTTGGNRVTLTGIGFGTVPTDVQVLVGGTAIPAGSIVGVTNTQIVYVTPAHTPGNAVVTVKVNGTMANGSATFTYGTVTPLPGAPPSGSGGTPNSNPLPGARPGGAPSGNPDPVPGSRP